MKRGVISAAIVASSNAFSLVASAEPLVWGSGSWGDTWLGASSVPALSSPALGLLAAALAACVAVSLRRRPARGR